MCNDEHNTTSCSPGKRNNVGFSGAAGSGSARTSAVVTVEWRLASVSNLDSSSEAAQREVPVAALPPGAHCYAHGGCAHGASGQPEALQVEMHARIPRVLRSALHADSSTSHGTLHVMMPRSACNRALAHCGAPASGCGVGCGAGHTLARRRTSRPSCGQP